jgi:predicted phosphodiesterase
MRYALISDVHANLPALEAVLADIASRSDIAVTYHLGDLVGYAPWPNETVERILAARIAGIAGNYDSTVGLDY